MKLKNLDSNCVLCLRLNHTLTSTLVWLDMQIMENQIHFSTTFKQVGSSSEYMYYTRTKRRKKWGIY